MIKQPMKIIKHVEFCEGCVLLLDNGMVEVIGNRSRCLLFRTLLEYKDDIQDICNLNLADGAGSALLNNEVFYQCNDEWYRLGVLLHHIERMKPLTQKLSKHADRFYHIDAIIPKPRGFIPERCFLSGYKRKPLKDVHGMDPWYVCLANDGTLYETITYLDGLVEWRIYRKDLPKATDVIMVENATIVFLSSGLLHVMPEYPFHVPEYLLWKGAQQDKNR